MSEPGPRLGRAVPARRVEVVRSGASASRCRLRLPRRGDPRARRGERLGEVDAARDRERLRPRGRGTVEIGGRRLRRASSAEARRLGLGIAYQTYSHVQGLSVAQNLFLAVAGDGPAAVPRVESWAAEQLAAFRLDLPADAPAAALSLAERQLLEVVKALLARPRVLLLDEPTTALGPADVERLHQLVFEQSRTASASPT